MDFTNVASAVFLGNALTVIFLWGCVQFHRYDYKAPWLAYSAFLMPILIFIASMITSGLVPPQFDALGLQ